MSTVVQNKRIYVEAKPLDTDYLENLQRTLLRSENFIASPRTGLHLTVLHFGKPREVHEELSRLGYYTDTSFLYCRALEGMLQQWSTIEASTFTLCINTLALFGPNANIVGVQFEKTEILKQIRYPYECVFCQFLQELRINLTEEDYIKTHNWFAVPWELYTPHISLGTYQDEIDQEKFTEISSQIAFETPVIIQ